MQKYVEKNKNINVFLDGYSAIVSHCFLHHFEKWFASGINWVMWYLQDSAAPVPLFPILIIQNPRCAQIFSLRFRFKKQALFGSS